MHGRRRVLVATGAALGGLAGCLGTPGPDTTPDQQDTSTTPLGTPNDANDGYPTPRDETPKERSIDTSSFPITSYQNTAVPLAPVGITAYWHARGEARFADARSLAAYQESHITGAVSSPANPDKPDPRQRENDPIARWPKDDRIVCYCGCPHHLSSIRAAGLLNSGYSEVYVIDEGFYEWRGRGYPITGGTDRPPQARVVEGAVDASYAGETAWARHEPSGQMEAGPIDDTGRFSLTLHFYDMAPTSPITIETPAYTVTAPLEEVTGAMGTGGMK